VFLTLQFALDAIVFIGINHEKITTIRRTVMLRIGIDALDEKGNMDRHCELELKEIEIGTCLVPCVIISLNDEDSPLSYVRFNYYELLRALNNIEKINYLPLE
jgi:hypothetical protein